MKASSGGIIEGAWSGIERKGESERRKETRRDGAAALEGKSGRGLTNGGHDVRHRVKEMNPMLRFTLVKSAQFSRPLLQKMKEKQQTNLFDRWNEM